MTRLLAALDLLPFPVAVALFVPLAVAAWAAAGWSLVLTGRRPW